MKIAVQRGLESLSKKLAERGYEVVSYRESGLDSRVMIIHDVDAEYEEIESVSYFGEGENRTMVLDASRLTSDQIFDYVATCLDSGTKHA